MTYHFLVESKPHERIDLLIITPPLCPNFKNKTPPPNFRGRGNYDHAHRTCTYTHFAHKCIIYLKIAI